MQGVLAQSHPSPDMVLEISEVLVFGEDGFEV
jgi:hypothetical protein